MTETDSYISVAMMRSVVAFLEQKGLDPFAIAAKANIPLDGLNEEDFLPAESYPNLMQAAIDVLQEPDLGFQLGKQAHSERWGVVGYILSSCGTVAEAMQCLQKYQNLVGNIGDLDIQVNGPFVKLIWDTKELPIPALAEEALAGWITFGRWVTGQHKSPKHVFFRHPPPHNIEEYEAFFECPIEFEAPYNAIEIPFTFLHLPLKNAEGDDKDWLLDQAEEKLNKLKGTSTFLIELQAYISENLPRKVPELNQAAEHFQMNSRALQRKLKKEDLTFKQLLDQTRMDLAKRFLQHSDYGIIDITFLLGFSEQSAFTRAFKRTTGQSPGEFRRSTLLTNNTVSH